MTDCCPNNERRKKTNRKITIQETSENKKNKVPQAFTINLNKKIFYVKSVLFILGGTSRAQWEDVTGSTPLTFVNDCVSFTTTVSARFWLMDCRNIAEATKMATELYREAIHVPFMAK